MLLKSIRIHRTYNCEKSCNQKIRTMIEKNDRKLEKKIITIFICEIIF